ncbi:MAG TPA: 30S ribosomal protein S20 [Candidatus Hypogeohydataceae bacterium YC40]
MPHLKSAFKSLRQDAKRRPRNRAAKSFLKTQLKKFATTLQTGNIEAVREQFQIITKVLDKTAAKEIIKKGTADRKKSQLAQKFNKLIAAGSEKKE